MERLTTNSGPSIIQKGSGYILSWPTHGVEARVSRLRETAIQHSAEVSIRLNGEGVTRSVFNLLSESGRTDMWRKLKRRRSPDHYPDLDWEKIVEELAAVVLDSVREGDPEQVLGDLSTHRPVTFLVKPFLIDREPNMIWADAGSGKSLFVLFLGVLLDTGYIDTDLKMTVQPDEENKRVLYLDWETKFDRVADRCKRIHNGLDLAEKSNIIYRRCTQPLVHDADRYLDLIDRYKVGLIIIDSMGLACPGLEEADPVNQFFRTLSWMDRTSLIVSHPTKAGQLFGSNYVFANLRNIWQLKRSPGMPRTIDLSMFHRKVNDAPRMSAVGWNIDFSDDQITFVRKDVYDTDDRTSLSIPELVFSVVTKEGPLERDGLAEIIADIQSVEVDKIRGAVMTAVSRHKSSQRLFEENGYIQATTSNERDS